MDCGVCVVNARVAASEVIGAPNIAVERTESRAERLVERTTGDRFDACYQTADELTVYELIDGYAQEYRRRGVECCDAEERATFFPGTPEGNPRD